jgi:hypothetical protein
MTGGEGLRMTGAGLRMTGGEGLRMNRAGLRMTKYGFSPYSSTVVDPPPPFLVQPDRGLGFRGHDAQHPGGGCGVINSPKIESTFYLIPD